MKHIVRFALFALPAIVAVVFVTGFHSEQLFAQGNEDLNANPNQDTIDQYNALRNDAVGSGGNGGIITNPVRSNDGDGMLAPADGGSGSGNTVNTTGSGSRSNTTGSGSGSAELKNPLKSQSIEEFLLKIIDVLLVFALPIIVLYIMYAGYLFATAQGDSGQVGEARSALLWAVVGGVIILGAKVIVTVIQGTITAF